MSSIKKLIEKIKILWNNRQGILAGVLNYVLKTEHVESVAKIRMDICRECPLIDLKGNKCFAPGTQPCCGSCGCSLEFKTRSLEDSCPEGKW